MATSFPISIPSSPAPRAISLRQQTAVAVHESPTTMIRKVYRHPGQRLAIDVSYPTMTRAQAAPILAALISLNGPEGSFYFGDTAWKTPQGSAGGTPLVKGGAQTGEDLITDGWPTSITGVLKAGDWIQIGSGSTQRLYMNLVDANSNGSGEATLTLWPRVREAFADNTALTVSSPKGVWRLVTPMSWDLGVAKLAEGLSFTAVEAL